MILFAGLASAQKTPVQWESIQGINYFPSYARNAHEMWLRYDAPTVERELRWLHGLGFNSVRLWLSEKAFRASPAAFRANLQACLRSCRRWGMTAMLAEMLRQATVGGKPTVVSLALSSAGSFQAARFRV